MRNLNVLFVDDEQFALHSMDRLLSKQHYGKYFALGGQEALEILASVPIHIIVSDMKMPGIDGLALLMAVKEKYPDIVRLVLSGYSQTAQLLPCINRGEIYRFITKPLCANELITSINDALELVKLRAEKNELTETLQRKNIALLKALEEKNLAQEQLKTLIMTDELTGIYNRRQCNIFLGREFIHSQRYKTDFSLIMLDLDHFKSINDTSGHSFGDYVLRTFASRARETIRETDVIFRYGGEEFMVLLPNTSLEAALPLGERILEMCRNTLYLQGAHSHIVTASIGLVSYSACKPNSPEELVEAADTLMYQAKQTGRNRLIAATHSTDFPPATD